MTVYVDLPTEYDEFKNVAIFTGANAREEAIQMCRERWGADEEGRVSLMSLHSQDIDVPYDELEEKDDQIHPHTQLQG